MLTLFDWFLVAAGLAAIAMVAVIIIAEHRRHCRERRRWKHIRQRLVSCESKQPPSPWRRDVGP